MAQNGNPAMQGQAVQIGMNCTVFQVAETILISVAFQDGCMSAALNVPPAACRAMARQLIEAADNADKTIIKPVSPLAPN
jgi:hypothetical protein